MLSQRAIAGFLLIAGCNGADDALPEPELDQPGYELSNGRWYTGDGFVETTFYVVGDELRAQRPSRVDSVLDLDGGFVVPPFGEAHTHRPSSPAFAADAVDAFLDSGIFYAMNHGSLARYGDTLRILAGGPRSVDVAFAHALVASPQSHGVELWQRLALDRP